MPTLPFELTSLIVGFASLFSKPIWKHIQVLLVGAILALGKRTVTAALRVCGLSGEKQFQTYHRVLNRVCWSSLSASRILLGLIVRAFAAEGALIFAIGASPPQMKMVLNRRKLSEPVHSPFGSSPSASLACCA